MEELRRNGVRAVLRSVLVGTLGLIGIATPVFGQATAPAESALAADAALPVTADDPAPQPAVRTAQPYIPITQAERILWITEGTVGTRSLGVGVLASGWQTAWNIPDEWDRTWSGAGKRYMAREADVAISNALEGGLGAIWGEDPRYIPAPPGPFRSRAAYAIKTVVLAPRRDGRLAPAWGRYAGNVFNNVIENSYLPPSMTTGTQTAIRSVNGLVSRLLGNLWEEFWPDMKRRLFR